MAELRQRIITILALLLIGGLIVWFILSRRPAEPIPTARISATPTPTRTATPEPANTSTPTDTTVPASLNDLINPYFEGVHNSTSIPGWTNSAWDISIKPSPCSGEPFIYGTSRNPSPNCTSARLAGPGLAGSAVPGQDWPLSQVVNGHGNALRAELACTGQGGGRITVTIYGGPLTEGPWEPVWSPFSAACITPWLTVLSADTTLEQGFAFYRFEIIGRWDSENAGVKVTNAHFESW